MTDKELLVLYSAVALNGLLSDGAREHVVFQAVCLAKEMIKELERASQ